MTGSPVEDWKGKRKLMKRLIKVELNEADDVDDEKLGMRRDHDGKTEESEIHGAHCHVM